MKVNSPHNCSIDFLEKGLERNDLQIRYLAFLFVSFR